jgi:two-component system capsular synthesis response regulator RcsB
VMPEKLHIILADDHPLFALGTQALIEQSGIGMVIHQASDSTSLVELLRTASCDVLVTDFVMPGDRYGDGLRLLGYLQRTFPRLPIIVLTMANNPGVLSAIWQLGVAALLSKGGVASELPVAIQAAASDRRYLSATIRFGVDANGRGRKVAEVRLSAREAEVLRLFASGLRADDIAHRLQRSPKTVSRQKRSGMAKLGVSTDSELFDFLNERQWVDAAPPSDGT